MKLKRLSAEEEYLLGVVLCGNANALKRLVERGTNPNFLTPIGVSPLDTAVEKGLTDCVEMLLTYGADPNMKSMVVTIIEDIPRRRTCEEWPPLTTAAVHNRPDCIALLLKFGADASFKDINDMSALSIAIRKNYSACVDALIGAIKNITNGMDTCVATMKGTCLLTFNEHKKQKELMIHAAVKKNDDQLLNVIFEKGTSDIDAQDSNGDTALHISVRKGYRNCVLTLLNMKANLVVQNMKGYTPLHEAAEAGDLEILSLLLKNGACINMRGARKLTPLHVAARSGNKIIVDALLKHGAKVDVKDDDMMTPLHYAITSLDKDCIQLLFNKGADPFLVSKHGLIPLSFALMESEEIFNMLLPPNINHITNDGVTPLHIAAVYRPETVKNLLDRGAVVNNQRTDRIFTGYTPLHMATLFGNFKAVELLLQHKADVNIKEGNGFSPLLSSAISGSIQCMRLLLNHGAAVNARSTEGQNALHLIGLTMGSGECASFLIEHGCHIEVRDKRGHTPLYISVLAKNVEVIKVLINSGANVFAEHKHLVTPLEASTMVGVECFEAILKISKHSKDRNGLTALHCAAAHSWQCLKLALEMGGNVNVKNNDGATPLHLAAEQGIEECVKLLIKNGANVNAVDMVKLTPLHRAASDGHEDCVKTLIEEGADIDAPALFRWTPLQLAAEEGHLGCIKVLVEKGANINSCDDNGITILMSTAKKANFECVKYLLEHDAQLWK